MIRKSDAPARRPRSSAKLKKSEDTRLRVIEAAGKIIGRYGYIGCSISRITARAGLAHGAFYLYFKSRQELFDNVLPVLGANMLDQISEAVRDSKGVVDLERRGLTANFEYLAAKPYMYRVLREAQLYAPKAYESHNEAIIARYCRSLQRSLVSHQVQDFGQEELRAVATMLIGARDYILDRYCVDGLKIKPLAPEILDTYVRFISHGLAVPLPLAELSL